jgi:hypothetical protein
MFFEASKLDVANPHFSLVTDFPPKYVCTYNFFTKTTTYYVEVVLTLLVHKINILEYSISYNDKSPPFISIIIIIIIIITKSSSSATTIMTEQSTSITSLQAIQNDMEELKKAFFSYFIIMIITGQLGSLPKQIEGLNSNNRTHLIHCRRRHIRLLFRELGYSNACQAYHMRPFIFWKLCALLRNKLEQNYNDPRFIHRIPNGPITHFARVSMALRYLAGGQAMDIALVHGVSHSEVFESLWLVVDAINQ